jgi:hypothetical protein
MQCKKLPLKHSSLSLSLSLSLPSLSNIQIYFLSTLFSRTAICDNLLDRQTSFPRTQNKSSNHHGCIHFHVEVTLRPTVSRPVRLGVLPLLEQVIRCYIYPSDNYFLYFSSRAPSLTRGRVCNLQCNDASSISSYIVTDGLSASPSCAGPPMEPITRF